MPVGSYALLKVKATPVVASRRFFDFISETPVKRSGAWWYKTNANNILKLRCAKYNRTYDRLIQKYKEIDREKTYAKFGLTNNF